MADWITEQVPAAGQQSMLHTAAASGGIGPGLSVSRRLTAARSAPCLRRGEQGWQQVAAPGIGRVNRAIAISDADVWAVGNGESLHWDGTHWQHVPTAALHDSRAQLFGLARLGSADVWAAGYAPRRDHSGSRGTVQRWDGAVSTGLPGA